MSAARRKALIAHARQHGAVIIEDDYDGEFRYDGNPLKALISENAADVVFYVGTFSKCMSPALRLGFVIAPEWAMSTLIAIKNCLDWHCPTATQAAVAAFIAGGHLTRHVRTMRRIYRDRRRVLMEELSDRISSWLTPISSSYGMHLAAVGLGKLDLEAIADRLLHDNMRIHTFSRYYLNPPDRSGLVFGLGIASADDIARGAERLRRNLQAS